MSTPPSPSPIHQTASAHTTDPARAILTVGRQAMPRAMKSWTRAKAVLAASGWRPMACPAQVIWWANPAGLPSEAPAIIWFPKALVNM